jgi:DNA-binding LytR/AlgR family response regulator
MTVIKYDQNNNPLLHVIDMKECDFIENEGRRIVYHIGNEKYFHISTKSELEILLEKEGFEVLDRPYLVNMDQISHFDENFNILFFRNHACKGKSVTVARTSVSRVRQYLQERQQKKERM